MAMSIVSIDDVQTDEISTWLGQNKKIQTDRQTDSERVMGRERDETRPHNQIKLADRLSSLDSSNVTRPAVGLSSRIQ